MSPVAAGMAYEVHGGSPHEERPPLVLIHGAAGNHLFWPPQLRRLEVTTVFALDLPGHGRSAGEGRDCIESYVEDLLRWIGALRLGPCVLAGHSMGSAVALMTALTQADRVAGLILVGAGGRLRVHPLILEKAASEATFVEAVGLIVQAAYGPHANRRLVELGRKRMLASRPEVLLHDLKACDSFDVLERLGEITAPALVLCGQEDQLTPEKYSRRLGEAMPQAEVQVVPDAGHMLMLEQPAAVADAARRFLLERFAAR
ncbi:MAG: alpha/beta hydrolase [Chloroflexota bacterium]